jgi:hypothetical protein
MDDNIYWVNGDGGSAALLDGGGSGVDFVRWGDSTEPAPAGTSWTGDNPTSPGSGLNLGRATPIDSDSGVDWCAQLPTFGGPNGICQGWSSVYLPLVTHLDVALTDLNRPPRIR